MDDADTFTIKGHGTVGIVRVDASGDRLNGAALSKLIMNHPAYQDSIDCVMFICNAGTGPNSLAQQVADITGLTVIAADGWVGQRNHVVYAGTNNGRGINPWQGVGWRTFSASDTGVALNQWSSVMTRQQTQSALKHLKTNWP